MGRAITAHKGRGGKTGGADFGAKHKKSPQALPATILSKDDKKDIFVSLLYGFELSYPAKGWVATASRREGALGRTGAPSVTFCGKEERQNG